MVAIAALGLLPSLGGTWLWTQKQEQMRQRDTKPQIIKVGAGDLRQALLFQETSRKTEATAAAAFLERMDASIASLSGEEAKQNSDKQKLEDQKSKLTDDNQDLASQVKKATKESLFKFFGRDETEIGNALESASTNATSLEAELKKKREKPKEEDVKALKDSLTHLQDKMRAIKMPSQQKKPGT